MDKFIHFSGVTAGSSFARVFSTDDKLRVKTAHIVIRRSTTGTMELDLYRMSGTVDGKWSRDLYAVEVLPDGGLRPRHVRELSEKYDLPPAPTEGSLATVISGHTVYSRDEIAPELRAAIDAIIRTAPPPRLIGG